MSWMKLVLGIILGALVGYVLFSLLVFGSALIHNCLKDCSFPIWPIMLIVWAPLLMCLGIDAKRRTLSISSVGWWIRRSFFIGMAVGTLAFTKRGSLFVGRLIRQVSEWT